MVSRVVKCFGTSALAVLAAGSALASEAASGGVVSEAELGALAAAYNQGALGSGSCPWVHPVDESPTTLPCELVPLPILSQMARNNANKHAQLEMGKRYEQGRGVAQDYAKARKFYRMAGRDLKRGTPVLMPGRDMSPLGFGEFGHGGTLIEAGLNRSRTPGTVIAKGLPEARRRLARLFRFDPQVSPPWSNAPF
jgi:hypothetical protein